MSLRRPFQQLLLLPPQKRKAERRLILVNNKSAQQREKECFAGKNSRIYESAKCFLRENVCCVIREREKKCFAKAGFRRLVATLRRREEGKERKKEPIVLGSAAALKHFRVSQWRFFSIGDVFSR